MVQRFVQGGFQLVDRRVAGIGHIDDLDREHRVATIGIATHQVPPLQEQGDCPPRSRTQIGRQPPHRYPHEAQAGGGATHTVRAIADATLGKQADQSATDVAVHLGQARIGIVVITIGGLT